MHANEITFSVEDKANSSMRNKINQATKRIEFQQLARSVAIGCTLVFSSPWSVVGQEATCGCEVSAPNCDGSCSKSKRPKQPSIAQQFLKQFDRIGDEIEAQVRFRPTALRWGKPASATCGVEIQGPSCGTEFGEPTCGTELHGSPPGLEVSRPKPLFQYESPTFETDPPASPIKKRPPSTPMHPEAPTDQQALGKIKDEPGKSSIPVRRQEPAQVQQDAPPAMPKSAKEPFTPRIPQQPPEAEQRSTSPSFNNSQSSELPSLPGATNRPATPIGLPDLPQSQDEIPDVLVDPFRDDVSRTRRDQMNGVLQTSGSVIDRPKPSTSIQSPIRLRAVHSPELEESSTSAISIGPSLDDSDSSVVTSSHLQRIPLRVHSVKRNIPALHEETHPHVNRTSVPARK